MLALSRLRLNVLGAERAFPSFRDGSHETSIGILALRLKLE
jgi:hypothetical protein